jgi:hypothetical protein
MTDTGDTSSIIYLSPIFSSDAYGSLVVQDLWKEALCPGKVWGFTYMHYLPVPFFYSGKVWGFTYMHYLPVPISLKGRFLPKTGRLRLKNSSEQELSIIITVR